VYPKHRRVQQNMLG